MGAIDLEDPRDLGLRSSGIRAAFVALRPLSGRRILVIDEVPARGKLTENLLSRLGCSFVVAGDGGVGLDLGLSGSFDVVVVAENLPALSGISICRVLSVLPAARRPFLVVLSATALGRCGARSAGADLTLGPDADDGDLRAWVEIYLTSHAAVNGSVRPASRIRNGMLARLATHPGLVEDHGWAISSRSSPV